MRSAALAQQIGQLLWVGFAGSDMTARLVERISRGEIGAIILFARNITTLDQLCYLTGRLHDAAPPETPLLIAVDQEGGRVQRIRAPATEWPPMLRLGELALRRGTAEAEALAAQVGRALGRELAALGFDIDFAQVLDVHTNPANPVIGDRAFATTPELAALLAGAFARGLAAAEILGCGKHFPGHGDTALDSHLALPRIPHAMERLGAVELVPFRALSWLPILMTAHVVFAALDDTLPATLSPLVVDGLLRRTLGYEGVIVSDDLEMKAIADHFGLEDAIERGLLAGCDAFLLCKQEDLQLRAAAALTHAAERSSKVRERIAESAARVVALKHGHFAAGRNRPPRSVVGCAEHREIAAQLLAVE